MDEEEAKAHMMRLVYHMLGVVNEIRIISNARIRKNCESEELCIERQKEAEKFLSERWQQVWINCFQMKIYNWT